MIASAGIEPTVALNSWPRRAELGRPADALAVTEEAVAAHRELAAPRPDRYRPDLALSLDSLSMILTQLGLDDAAAAASVDADQLISSSSEA